MSDWQWAWHWEWWDWLILAPLAILIWVVPLWRIIRRTGRHPALALLAVVPLSALLILWWLAFADWPKQQKAPSATG